MAGFSVIAVLLVAGVAHTAADTCLPDGILASQRKNITFADAGVEMPLGVHILGWASADLIGNVYKLLAEEVLGYNAVLSEAGGALLDSHQRSDRVPGCKGHRQLPSQRADRPEPMALQFRDVGGG